MVVQCLANFVSTSVVRVVVCPIAVSRKVGVSRVWASLTTLIGGGWLSHTLWLVG